MNRLRDYLDELTEYPDFLGLESVGPQTRGHFGSTPLHFAAGRGDLDALGWLLDAGVDINAAGEHGYTALHEAVGQSQREAVRLLLARGASRTLPNSNGDNAQQLAELLEDQETADLLRDNAPSYK